MLPNYQLDKAHKQMNECKWHYSLHSFFILSDSYLVIHLIKKCLHGAKQCALHQWFSVLDPVSQCAHSEIKISISSSIVCRKENSKTPRMVYYFGKYPRYGSLHTVAADILEDSSKKTQFYVSSMSQSYYSCAILDAAQDCKPLL